MTPRPDMPRRHHGGPASARPDACLRRPLVAVGRLAVGCLAVGRLAVGRLAVGRLAAGLLAALATACGPTTMPPVGGPPDLGMTPSQQCRAAAVATCQRVYVCATPAQKAGSAFQATFGTSESDCEQKLPDSRCSSFSDAMPCPKGQAYDRAAATQCVADIQAASCTVINSGTLDSAACARICQIVDGGA